MILEKDIELVESSGFASTKTAEIKATPAMLRMLSSGIYSDKISAFIRELSTNAYDAMVEAGTIHDDTFDVHLPTKLEPWFSIRDKGTGLSTDGMENNFSNFGDGTKAESNVYNGAYGLGSKSPLSYTRDFTIISYYNNQKTFYNYGLNDENIPVLSTAFTQPSDEPSGLDIQIAIKNSDIEEVQRKAELIYRYFNKKPNTNIDIQYHELPKLIEGKDWYLTKPDFRENSYGGYYKQTTPTRIIMGNVIYPITVNGLSQNSFIFPMTQIPFVINVAIGDVQMTPSRETLEMTPKTIQFLESKYKEILGELSTNLEKKLDPSLCVFDKVISSFELLTLLPGGITSCQIDKFKVSSKTYEDIFKIPEDFSKYCTFKRVSKNSSFNHRKTEDFLVSWRPRNSLNYMFLIVDSKNRMGTILEVLKNKYDHVYIIRPANGVLVDSKEFKDAITLFFNSCGSPQRTYATIEASKLPPVIKVAKNPSTVPQPRAKASIKARHITHTSYASTGREIIIPSDSTDIYYYVQAFRGYWLDVKGDKGYALSYCLPKMISDLEEKLGKTINVILVTGTYTNRVKKDNRFISLLEEVSKYNFTIGVSSDFEDIRALVNKSNIDMTVRKEIQKISGLKISDLFTLYDTQKIDNNIGYKDTFIKHNYSFVNKKGVDLTNHKVELEKYKDLQFLNYKTPIRVIKEFITLIDNRKIKE